MYDGPQVYVFSGSLTVPMVNYLIKVPGFEPIDALVSQVDRNGVEKMLQYMEMGAIKSFFMDSGAYSIHSMGLEKVHGGKFKTIEEFVDDYIEFANSLDDKLIAIAQVDHIPGKFRQPKTPQDYIESTELSWENFLYMYKRLKSPEKLIAVMHQGESFDYLTKLLEWRDDNGKPLSYIGISPSNDRGVNEKDVYLQEVYEHIAKSSNPDVKTHLFGYTSLQGLSRFPWYSCDSISHRLRSGFNKLYIVELGTISLSRTREVSTSSDKMFLEVADEAHIKLLKDVVEGYGFTIDQLLEDSAARTVVDMMEIKRYLRMYPYKPENFKVRKKLFKID